MLRSRVAGVRAGLETTGRLLQSDHPLKLATYHFRRVAYLCRYVTALGDELVIDGGVLEHVTTRPSCRRFHSAARRLPTVGAGTDITVHRNYGARTPVSVLWSGDVLPVHPQNLLMIHMSS